MEWNKKAIDKEQVKQISEIYNIPLLSASILVRRGITDPQELIFILKMISDTFTIRFFLMRWKM